MSESITITLIKTAPALLWVLFATIAFLALRHAIIARLGRVKTAALPSASFDFTETLELVTRAANAPVGKHPTETEQVAVVSRMEHAADIMAGGRILWVDDHPELNTTLTKIFRAVDMKITTAISTDEALAELSRRSFDLIITDMKRQHNERAGLDLLERLESRRSTPRVIMFATDFDPQRGVHPGLFSYSNSSDDLIHCVIDVMERKKFARSHDSSTPTHTPAPLPRPGER